MRSKRILVILVLMVFAKQTAFAGTIIGWGDNWSGKASPPSGSDFVAIAAGGHHGLALKADGSIEGWGWDSDGQATPPAGNDYVAMSGGLAHSIALKANGSIVGWGLNSYGQATPPAGSDYVAIAAGGWHSLAINKDGSSVGWGSNNFGRATPPAGNNYAAIDAGGYHSVALKADSSITAWGVSDEGSYDFGQVTDAPTDSNYVAIAAGWYHNIALKNDGSIVAWGISDGSADDYGQVTDTPTGNGFVAIAAGHWHNLALKADGTIVGWGRNNYNQTTPPAGKDFVVIDAGGDFSLVLTESTIGTGFIYQGRLIDTDYPADDIYDFRFELYNDMTTGMQQGTTIYRDDVGVSDGYFTVSLDFGMDVIDSNALWLEIGVRPGDVNDPNLYTRLSPRQRITPTPYAVHASSSETVQAPLELSGSVAAPNSVLLVENHFLNGSAIRGENSSSGTYGYLGGNTDGIHGWGGLAGVMGQNSSGYGVWATSISGSGVFAEQFNSGNHGYLATGDYGVYGRGMAASSYGVYGIHNSSGNYGYLGTSNSGVYGSSDSGIAGYFTSSSGYGLVVESGSVGIGTTIPVAKLDVQSNSNLIATNVWNSNSSGVAYGINSLVNGKGGTKHIAGRFLAGGATENFAIYADDSENKSYFAGSVGIGTSDPCTAKLTVIGGNVGIGTVSPSCKLEVRQNGTNYAIYGKHDNSGTGVFGQSSSGTGVYGHSSDGFGVVGYSSDGYGVYGDSFDGYGVYGRSMTYFAGYFDGHVHVTDTINKSACSFKIDHPLDPEDKYLYHSVVESPDMMNIYNGNVKLDENGQAVVQLPDYFEALNYDFRYQLTPIGAPGPNLYIAEKISENNFKIAGGKYGMEVSWQVTGIRQDPYAVANRIQVEEDKSDEERGYYLHPKAYGFTEEKGIERLHNPEPIEQAKGQESEVSHEASSG
ncbi:MAG: hypothetical protein GWN67_20635 [Phycisphaerae bacterium]|nr:hypothetical protein [Phycisphaerae bacterium]NIR65005.1 hypothetical protein [candidate division Zixibacteria bacterium]NIS54601.1 hypothetical protein [Phycisphaerae bacterium]NIU10884.1 hypothetical protein [Phycisphaerae bacterium]NIU58699.1 hypothetical protein [Phycisphaerae bacterium]